MSFDAEVIVAGAGPAGSVAARTYGSFRRRLAMRHPLVALRLARQVSPQRAAL